MIPTPIPWKDSDVQTPPSDVVSETALLGGVLRKWSARLRGDTLDRQLQSAGADLLDGTAAVFEDLERENRALFEGYQDCIADRARLAEENAALRTGQWPRGVFLKVVTGLLLIAFGCGLAGAVFVRFMDGCG